MKKLGLMIGLIATTMLPALGQEKEHGLPLILHEDFEKGASRWTPTDAESWELLDENGNKSFGNNKRISNYQPKFRSPHNIALLNDVEVEDTVITFRVKSTKDTGNHRDCCVFFGYQDPDHFYYVHLGAKPDPASGQIMIVNGEARRPITTNEKEVPWTDRWHTVKLVRNVASGEIAVYFDDMANPLMSVTDKTFGTGKVGIGSFDDMNAFDDVRIFGKNVKPKSAEAKPSYPDRPEPTFANFSYGNDSNRQKFDFWQAQSEKPTPVVLLVHGGGWTAGDKRRYGTDVINRYLKKGISVAAVNYRFIAQAMEQNVSPPVKAPVTDVARALQTIRRKAKEWNVDPTRIGATGGSAGACTSLWIGLHDDLANPNSEDEIARESTRLQYVAVSGAQTSLDPKELREWISNSIYGGHAFGFAAKGRNRAQEFELLLEKREEVLPWIKEYSPIELVTSDDPPIFLEYPNQKTPPVFGGKESDPTHSAMYGIEFQKKCKKVGVSCDLVFPGNKDSKFANSHEFLIHHLSK